MTGMAGNPVTAGVLSAHTGPVLVRQPVGWQQLHPFTLHACPGEQDGNLQCQQQARPERNSPHFSHKWWLAKIHMQNINKLTLRLALVSPLKFTPKLKAQKETK